MLVEANHAGHQQDAVHRVLAGRASETVVGHAFTPDLVVGGEAARAALNVAGREEGRQRLAAVHV